MNILNQIIETLEETKIPIETGIFSKAAPDEYLVITPMSDIFEAYADDFPTAQVMQARISFFSKKNYIEKKQQIEQLLLQAGMTITDRRYVGHEDDTKYHHVAIDVEKEFEF